MLPRTETYLEQHPEIWDDGYLAFSACSNGLGTAGKEAVLAFFGDRFTVAARSGHGSHDLFVTEQALFEIDLQSGHRALVELVENDLRMFSSRKVDRSVIKNLVSLFFAEMGACRVYSNTAVYAPGERSHSLGPWSPVTKHTIDTFICVVSDSFLAYWLYGDDE